MKEKLQSLIRIFLSKQFIIFVLVGCVNTCNGVLFPILFSLVIENMNLAYMISYIPSLTISYVLNSYFTFKEKHLSFTKCIKFMISYLPNFLIQNVVFFVVYNLLELPKIIATILAAIIGLPVTFLIMKLFTFKKEVKENEE